MAEETASTISTPETPAVPAVNGSLPVAAAEAPPAVAAPETASLSAPVDNATSIVDTAAAAPQGVAVGNDVLLAEIGKLNAKVTEIGEQVKAVANAKAETGDVTLNCAPTQLVGQETAAPVVTPPEANAAAQGSTVADAAPSTTVQPPIELSTNTPALTPAG